MKRVFALVLGAATAILAQWPAAGADESGTTFVGGQVCAQCHEDAARAWTGSHHDLAMQSAGEDTVLGDFDDASFTHFQVTSRFFRRGADFMVHTDGRDGRMQDFRIAYTFGVHPLQQYLVEFDDGRLQALPLAWDSRTAAEGGQRWFHLYPGDPVPAGDVLHWTGPNQNWNFVCADCHSTNLARNYDAANDTYDTTWSEMDVSCEACHGPGSRHVSLARAGDYGGETGLLHDLARRGHWSMNPATGIAENPLANGHAQVEACARCHSRRIPLAERYRHDRPWTETYRPQVLLEDLYHADGQIDDEVYVYGSFVQSGMHARGVACTDCHDAHSMRLKAEGNALCGTCHLATKYDDEAHHFHPASSEGARCVACHMPAKTYMVNDARRDHGFRVPRPDLAGETGSPDACTGCHLGREPAWAAAEIARRHPASTVAEHFGVAIGAGRRGELDAASRLIELADDTTQPSIARATAANLLGQYIGPVTVQTLAVMLRDPDPLIRVNAVEALGGADQRLAIQLLPDLLDDDALMVRIAVVPVLAGANDGQLGDAAGDALEAAIAEYVAVQEANADRPESLINLGNLHLRLGNLEQARFHYEDALLLDPSHLGAYINLADFHRRAAAEPEVDRVLRDGIARLPDAAALHHALGLSLVRQGRLTDALDRLATAVRLDPANVRFRYVHAVALDSVGRSADALAELERAYETFPADTATLTALVDFHRKAGSVDEARRFAADYASLQPWNPQARQLLESLSE